jgi:non-ribosomal peptide synthetase component E (peptide arylation enzyme)
VQQLREGVTVHDVLGAVLDHADRDPDRPAVKDLDRGLTRGELRAAAGRVAAGLVQKGVEPGDRVSVGGGHVRSVGDHRPRSPPCADRG